VTRYAADSRDRVLEAIDMVSLVGARVQLRRAGVNSYFGNCPFHDERTGSFHVSPDERLYHCFGCQASGDAFTYVMETEGLDFKEALESLADRFGVGLQSVEEDPQAQERRRHRDRLHELLGRTASFYERSLWETAEAGPARDYLAGRGLEPDTLRAFHVGYAPDSFDRVLIGSRKAGFGESELVDAGLVRRSARSRAGAVDFFREQIMFPAADARGRVRGFGARRMRDDQPVAKYVNTPDGVLYHKREVLFGIDLARAEAAKQGRMILVEGYTDVLACHQAGIRNVVGIMGTSFTEEQLAELERVVKVLELCLDADSAGQEAVLRAARLAAGRHLELRVIVLPEGSDPADLAQSEGAQALGERLGASIPFVTFDVERILGRGDCASAEGRDRALAELAPAFATLAPSVLRDQLIRRVSGALELSDARVAGLLADPPPVATPRGGIGARNGANGRGGGRDGAGRDDDDLRGGPPASAPSAPGTRSERLFLALCIAVPDAGERALGEGEAQLLFGSEALRRVARHLRGRTRTPLSDLPVDDEPFARVVAGLVELAGRVLTPSADRLEHARLVLDLERLERAILRARAEGEGTNELAREREQAREAYRDVVSRLEGTL
jgi:DNA primase